MNRIKLSVSSSIKDGVCWAAMFGLVETYAVPFALSMGASNTIIGFLRTLPVLMACFTQVFTEFLVYYFRSCKKVVFLAVFFQALSVALASLTVFIPYSWAIYVFIFFMIFYSSFGAMSAAPWFTLMGEYLPCDKRGQFFGFRNRLIAVSYFSASLIAALFLSHFGEKPFNFFLVFISAAFLRFFSAHFVSRMYEPSHKFHVPKTFSGLLFPLLKRIENKNIYRLFLSVFILFFSTYLAAPYFSVYMLKELKFDYVRYMLLANIGQFLTWMLMKNWGVLLDKKGAVSVMKYAFYFIPVVSFLWILSDNFYYLLCVEIFSGVAWGAFGLSVVNLAYEYIEPALRTRYNSYLIFIMSVSQFLGSLAGGIIYDKMDFFPFSTFLFILALSTLGRFAAFLHFKSVAKDMCPKLP